MPYQAAIRTGITIGIERIRAVMHRRHEHHVVRPLSRDRQPGNIQRLPIDLAVDWVRDQQTERVRVDVRRGQNGFVRVLPGAEKVIVVRQHITWLEAEHTPVSRTPITQARNIVC